MKELIEALQIFAKYTDAQFPTNCEHDVLYVSVEPELVSKEDKVRLEQLGFEKDKVIGGFYSYKYGSN